MKEFITKEIYFSQEMIAAYYKPTPLVLNNFFQLKRIINIFFVDYYIFSKTIFPFYFTSVWRPAEYNRKVGGSKNSLHTKGFAIDIFPKNLRHFLLFLKSPYGVECLKKNGIYYYIGYTNDKIDFFHFQILPTTHYNRHTNQFFTKKYLSPFKAEMALEKLDF